jgi:hypothetical protein
VDPRYLGEEIFIMRRMGRQELPLNANHGTIDVYNKMHVGFRVQVERGISGQKWRHLMKRFDATKPKLSHLFQAECSPCQLPSPSLDGLHVQDHWRSKPWPYCTRVDQKGEGTLKWTKNSTCGVHSFIFLKILIQMFSVLAM